MYTSYQTFSATLLLLCLTLSLSILPSFVYAAPLANTEQDWQYTNGNSWGWNYSPETQIDKNNVQNLEVKWIFPLPGKSTAAVQALAINEGSTTPPLVVNGKVFVTTNYLKTYAINASNGKQAWVNNYVINPADVEKRIPILLPANAGALGLLNNHLHGIKYWEKGDALLINGMACDFYGINATDGTTFFWVKDLCKDVPGNLYKYRQGTASQDGIGTYDKGNQFIFVLPGAMHSNIYSGDGRNVMMGIDTNTKQVIWKVFNYPPQDVPTKDWALQECDIGYFQTTPCTDVAAQAPGNLEWDWAQPNQPPDIYGGVTAVWGGQMIVDEDTGILYTQTGNQGPYSYVGTTPGPRLYGSTIMAIDLNQGNRIWWLQPFPRDMYDYDCAWGGILANVNGLGEVYMKGCKEGILYVMNATSGEPLYTVNVINEQYQWGQIDKAGTLEPNQGGLKYHLNDPFNNYDMRQMVSPDNSTYCGRPCSLYPYFLNGIFATDMSYDPNTQTLYHYAAALQGKIIQSPPPKEGGVTNVATMDPIMNTTIVARDVATGNVTWTYFYGTGQQRSSMVVTPSILFTGFTDGYMRFFDKDTGKVLREMNLGSDLKVGVTTGQDSDGNQLIFTIVGISSPMGGITPTAPGTVVAIGLSSQATIVPAGGGVIQTTTVTTTQSTTITSTLTPQTVTSTTSAPAQTVTATQSVTETIGLPSEITYAAVAIAVITIVAAGILATRRRP